MLINKKQKNMAKLILKKGEHCVHNIHGLADVTDIETIEVFGSKSEFYVLYIEKEKLTIKVSFSEANSFESPIRAISSKEKMNEVFAILTTGNRKVKGMWSRRIKEYENKINSGDVLQIAEVIRDLTRDIEESQRAFGERMIYEDAIFKLASELSILENISYDEAQVKIKEIVKQKIQFEDIEKMA
ncbi:MAG: CarD family transcriptional regulator [Rickettsiales bacterium]|nr:MAG: CarD family transcriptional regulator [Rickettsiales bacterium]